MLNYGYLWFYDRRRIGFEDQLKDFRTICRPSVAPPSFGGSWSVSPLRQKEINRKAIKTLSSLQTSMVIHLVHPNLVSSNTWEIIHVYYII